MDPHRFDQERKYYQRKVLQTARSEVVDPARWSHNHVFLIFGFTGSGKDTLINAFLEQTKLPFSEFVRTLTRAKRPSETEALSGFFIERDFFDYLKERNRFFYWYRKYDGDEFGYDTLHFIFEITKGHVLMIGGGEANRLPLLMNLERLFNGVSVHTIFINRPKEAIREGLLRRGGEPDQVQKRLEALESQWKEKPEQPMDAFIWNLDKDQALREFTAFIISKLQA